MNHAPLDVGTLASNYLLQIFVHDQGLPFPAALFPFRPNLFSAGRYRSGYFSLRLKSQSFRAEAR